MSVAENKALVNRYFEEVHNGRAVAVLDEVMGPELAVSTREVVAAFQTAFPDYRITITAQVAEGDLVATVWRTTGTHQGEWPSPIGSIAPTGQTISFTGTTTARVTDGRIVEVVGTNHDHLGILQQMGALPAGSLDRGPDRGGCYVHTSQNRSDPSLRRVRASVMDTQPTVPGPS